MLLLGAKMNKKIVLLSLLGVFLFLMGFVMAVSQIDFTNPTPDAGVTTNINSVYINISSSDSENYSLFIDWNKTLVGWWSFESVLVNGTVYDNSTYRNNGLMNNFTSNTTTTGIRGNAVIFDGVDSHINVGNGSSLNLINEITIEAWVKSNSEGYILAKDPAGASQAIFYVDINNCSGWTGNPCSDTDIKASSGAGTLTCTYQDNLTTATQITRVNVQGYHDFSCSTTNVEWKFQGAALGSNYTTNDCYCTASAHFQNFTYESPSNYNISGTNTITLQEYGTSWASLHGGTFAGYAVNKMLKVTVDYNSGKTDVPYALSTMNGGEFLIRNSTASYNITSSTNLNDGIWHHIVGTYNGSKMSLYVDGNLKSTSTNYSGVLPLNDDSVWIGRHWNASSTGNFFNGSIDEVRIYSRALSPEEINASYNANLYNYYHNFTNLSDKTYTYKMYGIDLSGNINKTEERTIIIDTVPRVGLTLVSPTGSMNATVNQTFTVSVNVSCSNANCGEINVSLDPAGTIYNFTTCGASGVSGPTSAQCNSTYNGTSLQGIVILASGIQNWTVPETGVYTIEAVGASGIRGPPAASIGGYGAVIKGDFILTAGTVLKILVGQNGSFDGTYAGGGGGEHL